MHRTLLVGLVGRGFILGECIAIISVARPLELLFWVRFAAYYFLFEFSTRDAIVTY